MYTRNAMSSEKLVFSTLRDWCCKQRTYEVDYGATGTLRCHSDGVHSGSEHLCKEAMLRRGRRNAIYTTHTLDRIQISVSHGTDIMHTNRAQAPHNAMRH